MKALCLGILTISMAACGDAAFRSRPEASNLAGKTETSGNVDAAGSSTAGSSTANTITASSADIAAQEAAAAKAKQLAELDPAAIAAAEKCPGLDPVLIDKLIKTGQPFEVECEIEIEVGPDAD